MVEVIKILSKDHKKWVQMARSFGLTDTAEDLVQDMYIKINDWKGKYNNSLMYNETEVNQYFVFITLRNLFLDHKRKEKRQRNSLLNYKQSSYTSNNEYEDQLELIKKEIKNWHLYDRKIYELIFQEGKSMLELSKLTGIDYYSIYRTVKKIKKIINKKLEL